MMLLPCDRDGGECADHVQHFALDGVPAGEEIRMKDVSDGHHSFRDLYMHRMALTLALAHSGPGRAWRTKLHHPDDSPMFEGMFLVGIELAEALHDDQGGLILYHHKLQYWDLFDGIPECRHAPKWDGAGPEVTVERLLNWRKGWKVF